MYQGTSLRTFAAVATRFSTHKRSFHSYGVNVKKEKDKKTATNVSYSRPPIADLAHYIPRQDATMSIFDTEVLAASKESHRGELDHRQASQENTLLSSPLLPPPLSSCWFDDLLQLEHENMMVICDGNRQAGEEVSGAQVVNPSDMSESRKMIGIRAGE